MREEATSLFIIFLTGVVMAEAGNPPTPPPPTSPPAEEEVTQRPEVIEVADFFPEVNEDLTEVTWAHGVNSEEKLEVMLADTKIMMLEADILSGQLKKKKTEEEEGEKKGEGDSPPPLPPGPIMAHPPDKESDLSVAMWLDKVIEANQAGQKKGIKMDFKEIGVVKESLEELVKRKDQITFPVWLNADILPGPDSPVTPVDPTDFLTTCADLYPQATLSVGWTTYVPLNSAAVEVGYGRERMEEMVKLLEAHSITQPVTFPIRAALVPHSIDDLEWLLEMVPDSTLNVWSSPHDPFDPEAILTLVDLLGVESVYLDLPESQMTQYRKVAAAAAAASAKKVPPFCLLPTSASAWASVGMALATALAALYLYE